MSRWEKAQIREKTYLDKRLNERWNTPHSYDYWVDFLGLDNIPENSIELGCGPNGLWRYSDKVFGIDPLDFSEYGFNFIQGIGEDLRFLGDESVSMVIICNALDHTKEPGKVVEEAYRVLRKGGVFVVMSNVFPKPLVPFFKVIDGHAHLFSPESLLNLFDERFKVVKCVSKSFSDTHLRYVSYWPYKVKLQIAELLGCHMRLVHLEKS